MFVENLNVQKNTYKKYKNILKGQAMNWMSGNNGFQRVDERQQFLSLLSNGEWIQKSNEIQNRMVIKFIFTINLF